MCNDVKYDSYPLSLKASYSRHHIIKSLFGKYGHGTQELVDI